MTTLAPAPAAAGSLDLWPHQRDALDFARERTASLLAIPMSGGKSRVTIDFADELNAAALLILCPKNVVDVWPREIAKHSSREWHIWAGQVRGARGPLASPTVAQRAHALLQARRDATRLGLPFAAIVNYDASWHKPMLAALEEPDWSLLACDESHRLKSPSGKQSRAAARLATNVRSTGGRVLLLTGTPMPHTPLDIWAQYRVLDGGEAFGTSHHRFCQEFGDGEQIWAPGGIQRTVYKGIRPDRLDTFTRRVSRRLFQVDTGQLDATLGLPDAIDTYRTCDLEPRTRRAYGQLEDDLIADVDGQAITASNAMVLTTRLSQVTGGLIPDAEGRPVRIGDEKGQLLADQLADISPAEQVIVFCRFRGDLDTAERVAGQLGRRYAELSGRRRDALTSEATLTPGVQVAGVQLQSGGVGIDLTGARIAIYYSVAWSLADYLQSRKRLHRHGQTRTVTYLHLLARDTIDEAIYRALSRREQVVAGVLERLRGPRTA